MEMKKLSLDGLGGGVIPELFAHEVERVMENIADVNTEAEAMRAITITLEFKPDSARSSLTSKITVRSKLAGVMSAKAPVYLRREAGKIVGYTVDPNQQALDFETDKVAPIEGRGKETTR